MRCLLGVVELGGGVASPRVRSSAAGGVGGVVGWLMLNAAGTAAPFRGEPAPGERGRGGEW